MIAKVWTLRSFLMVQFVSALRVLPQGNKTHEVSLAKILDVVPETDPIVEEKRRSNIAQNFLGTFKELRSSKGSSQKRGKGNAMALRHYKVAAEPMYSPSQMSQAQRDEAELKRIIGLQTGKKKSELLGIPYIEKKGRDDYLVIQQESLDPFVTVIPNSIYYDIEKKCVNWLDACSLRGIRNHLLKKIDSTYT